MAFNQRVGRAVLELRTDSAEYHADIAKAKADGAQLGQTWQRTQTQLQGMASSLQAHAARIASFFFDLFDATEQSECLEARFVSRKAACLQALDFAIEMELQFFVQVRFATIAKHDRAQPALHDVPQAHD